MDKRLYDGIINKIKEWDSEDDDKSLLRVFLSSQFNLDSDEVEECIVDGSNDYCIDAVFLDEKTATLHILQSKFEKNKENKIHDISQKKDLLSLNTAVEAFLKKDATVFGKNKELNQKHKEYHNFCDDYISDKLKEPDVMVYFVISRDVGGESIIKVGETDITIVDIKQLRDQIEMLTTNEKYVDLELPVTQQLSYNTDNFDSQICICKIKDFKDSLAGVDYKDLLYENVRMAYQDSSINSRIKETLEGNEIEYFYLYNNGITLICNHFVFDSRNSKVILKGASIINGGQTTHQIINSSINCKDGEILVRVLKKVSDNNVNENISLNLNNQNSIDIIFKYSKNEFVQLFQREINDKTIYFLEIKENEYVNMQPEGKRKTDVIKLEKLIQVFLVSSCHEKAYAVKNEKAAILNNAELVKKVIDDCFKYDYFVETYRDWLMISDLMRLQRSNRRKDAVPEDMLDAIIYDYDFITTADYLLLYTISYHELKLDISELKKLCIVLYDSIDDLRNNQRVIMAKKTHSKEVFGKIELLEGIEESIAKI